MGRLLLIPLSACLFSTLLLAQAMSATPLKVSTTPIFPAISRDKMNKDFQVLLNIEAPPAANSHVPIDVVVVLDVSGSMNDPVVSSPAPESSHASRLDVLKAAMRFVVRTLDEGDRLSIVAFNDGLVKEYSTGLLDISGDGRSIAGRKVEQLEARGGTALMPALEKAIRILDERAGNSRSRLGFILLLTDGDDTSGFRWSRDAIHGALSRYPVHTFGLGSAHDPEPLLHIAQESRGTYSFVEDENLDKIAGSLAVCVGGLKTVAAVDTRVTLKAVELSGARIERIDSGGFESRVACGGASGEVVIGVLYAGEVKSFVVHLNVPASSSSSAECGYCDGDTATVCDFLHHCHHFRQQHLLDVGCKYAHAPGAAAVSIDGDGVFVQRPEVGAVAVDGNRPVVLPSPVVLQHLVRFELLELVAGVAESEMLVKATKQPHGNSRAGDVLQSKWEEFRRGRQFWGGVELDGVAKEVDAMVSSLGRGLGYVGSWVSSQQMQRATAMGSPDKVVAEFLTPAMVTTLEKAQKLPPPAAISGCAGAGAGDDDLYEVIGQRLELWSKVRREAPLMYKPSSSSSEEEELMTAVFREASLEAIDRAMHRDIYLAVVHASNQRRLYDGRNDRAPGR